MPGTVAALDAAGAVLLVDRGLLPADLSAQTEDAVGRTPQQDRAARLTDRCGRALR